MTCLCGHSQTQHDPEDKVCDAHATEGLGRCPCPGFVPNDEIQLRVAWNRADLYDIAARQRRAARDERDLYRKECERLREQLHGEKGMAIHKVYRSKNGDYFACDATRGAGAEGWDVVTCPDCRENLGEPKALSPSSPLETALSSLRQAQDAQESWTVSPTEAAALVAEIERLYARLATEEGERLQLLDDMGGIESERDALRREVVMLRKENAALRDAMVEAARRLGRAQQEAERERGAARSDVEAQVEAAHARGAAKTLAEVVRKIRDERSLCLQSTVSRATMDRILDVVVSKEPTWEDE